MIALATTSGASGALLFFVVILVLIYFIPTVVAVTRKVTNSGSVFVINFLLGWTLVGWAVALAMAVKTNVNQTRVIIEPALPRCVDCGSTLQPGMKFCAECGTPRRAF
jgi:hypothetical protein